MSKAKLPPLKTGENFKALSNEAIGHLLEVNRLKAEEAQKIDAIKAEYSDLIDGSKKLFDSIKTRLRNFALKHGVKVFATDKEPERSTGTITTSRAKVSLKINPASIKKADEKADDDHLISEAKRMGFGNVIKTKEVFDIEAMEKLTDAELARLGYKRVKERKTFTIEAVADKDTKDKETIQPEEQSDAA